jgi:GNAT superfamily N-acetyltransferase
VLVGWHEPPGVARAEVEVLPERRGHGLGSALFAALGGWAWTRGYTELLGTVAEDDPASLAWAERRGFREVGRNSLLVLDLDRVEAPSTDPPAGIEVVSWAERPELARGMYEVACEAYPDVPGEGEQMAAFEDWLSVDMQGSGDRPDATFVAVAGGEVVGYAKFSLTAARPRAAAHDLTAVRRAWRGRGVARALKATQIGWAKANGFEQLDTRNEERNAPIRRLNDEFGYRPGIGRIHLQGPLAP